MNLASYGELFLSPVSAYSDCIADRDGSPSSHAVVLLRQHGANCGSRFQDVRCPGIAAAQTAWRPLPLRSPQRSLPRIRASLLRAAQEQSDAACLVSSLQPHGSRLASPRSPGEVTTRMRESNSCWQWYMFEENVQSRAMLCLYKTLRSRRLTNSLWQ